MGIKFVFHTLLSAYRITFQIARSKEFKVALFALRENRRLASAFEDCETPDGHVRILSQHTDAGQRRRRFCLDNTFYREQVPPVRIRPKRYRGSN